MAQKTNPIALRLGIKQFWYSNNKNPKVLGKRTGHYSDKNNLFQDLFIRRLISGLFESFGYLSSEVIIHRKPLTDFSKRETIWKAPTKPFHEHGRVTTQRHIAATHFDISFLVYSYEARQMTLPKGVLQSYLTHRCSASQKIPEDTTVLQIRKERSQEERKTPSGLTKIHGNMRGVHGSFLRFLTHLSSYSKSLASNTERLQLLNATRPQSFDFKRDATNQEILRIKTLNSQLNGLMKRETHTMHPLGKVQELFSEIRQNKRNREAIITKVPEGAQRLSEEKQTREVHTNLVPKFILSSYDSIMHETGGLNPLKSVLRKTLCNFAPRREAYFAATLYLRAVDLARSEFKGATLKTSTRSASISSQSDLIRKFSYLRVLNHSRCPKVTLWSDLFLCAEHLSKKAKKETPVLGKKAFVTQCVKHLQTEARQFSHKTNHRTTSRLLIEKTQNCNTYDATYLEKERYFSYLWLKIRKIGVKHFTYQRFVLTHAKLQEAEHSHPYGAQSVWEFEKCPTSTEKLASRRFAAPRLRSGPMVLHKNALRLRGRSTVVSPLGTPEDAMRIQRGLCVLGALRTPEGCLCAKTRSILNEFNASLSQPCVLKHLRTTPSGSLKRLQTGRHQRSHIHTERVPQIHIMANRFAVMHPQGLYEHPQYVLRLHEAVFLKQLLNALRAHWDCCEAQNVLNTLNTLRALWGSFALGDTKGTPLFNSQIRSSQTYNDALRFLSKEKTAASLTHPQGFLWVNSIILGDSINLPENVVQQIIRHACGPTSHPHLLRKKDTERSIRNLLTTRSIDNLTISTQPAQSILRMRISGNAPGSASLLRTSEGALCLMQKKKEIGSRTRFSFLKLLWITKFAEQLLHVAERPSSSSFSSYRKRFLPWECKASTTPLKKAQLLSSFGHSKHLTHTVRPNSISFHIRELPSYVLNAKIISDYIRNEMSLIFNQDPRKHASLFKSILKDAKRATQGFKT